MDLHIGYIMTVSNSIIGVSILAMPYCFKQCGIVLAIVMLLASSVISRLTCHYLLKSATMTRRRTFELLAFHAFGPTGKLMVELGIIGFLMGTCIAFFVIIGDLGPAIFAKVLDIQPTDNLRTSLLVCLALFCVLPLGLLKNVESLSSVSTATIGFYFCLVLKTIGESASHFASGDWVSKVVLWHPPGVLQCLPIFAMALSCQTQLFEIYETLPNASLEKMNYVVRSAVNICVCVYVSVGFFGYVAFATHPFTGNILMSFSPSIMTDAMKIGFVLSVACSFPLVIFPCRASLFSLLFKKGYTPYEGMTNFIPETRFKLLTMFIVGVSLVIGILIPNIEVVLGLLGSTIGTMICVIFPVTCFICISTKNTSERVLAQIMLFIGVLMMVLGTYANLYAMEEMENTVPAHIQERAQMPFQVQSAIDAEDIIKSIKNKYEHVDQVKDPIEDKKSILEIKTLAPIKELNVEEVRQEPPQPEEPREDVKPPPVIDQKEPSNSRKIEKFIEKVTGELKQGMLNLPEERKEEFDKAVIEKEDKELLEEEKDKQKTDEEKKEIIEELKKHQVESQNLLEKQQKLLEEIKNQTKELKEKQKEDIILENEVRLKAASQIVEIAKKAIEILGPQKDENEPIKTNNMEGIKQIEQIKKEAENVQKDNENLKNVEKNIQSNQNVKNMVPLPLILNNASKESIRIPTKVAELIMGNRSDYKVNNDVKMGVVTEEKKDTKNIPKTIIETENVIKEEKVKIANSIVKFEEELEKIEQQFEEAQQQANEDQNKIEKIIDNPEDKKDQQPVQKDQVQAKFEREIKPVDQGVSNEFGKERIKEPVVQMEPAVEVIKTPVNQVQLNPVRQENMEPFEIIKKPNITAKKTVENSDEIVKKPVEYLKDPVEIIKKPNITANKPSEIVEDHAEIIKKPVEIVKKPNITANKLGETHVEILKKLNESVVRGDILKQPVEMVKQPNITAKKPVEDHVIVKSIEKIKESNDPKIGRDILQEKVPSTTKIEPKQEVKIYEFDAKSTEPVEKIIGRDILAAENIRNKREINDNLENENCEKKDKVSPNLLKDQKLDESLKLKPEILNFDKLTEDMKRLMSPTLLNLKTRRK